MKTNDTAGDVSNCAALHRTAVIGVKVEWRNGEETFAAGVGGGGQTE